nr:DddA-like double-stranded DNA deaminase toxin [Glycomyces amatae]
MAGLRPFDEAKTALGNLFFSSGKQNVQPLKATPGTTKFEPGEVKPGWQGTKPAQGHIEGNVAADMLHTGEMKGVLFLNVEPCDHGGTGCKSNTAHYLKPGVELQVKVYEGTRLKYRKRITGTGEALTGE